MKTSGFLLIVTFCVLFHSLRSEKHEKLLVQRVKTTVNTISLQWRAPEKISINLSPPQIMVYHFLLANGSQPINGRNIPWSSKGVKIGLSSDQSNGSAIIEDLHPNSKYLVKVEDGQMNETLIVETKDGCLVNSTIYELGERFNISCQQSCLCKSNSTVDCKPRCQDHKSSPSNLVNCRKIADPKDPECCSVFHCPEETFTSSGAKVLVTGRTVTTLRIAWDDFKLPNYQSGYLVEFRPISASDSDPWHRIQANNTPFWTLQELLPNTSYMIRISLWEDNEKMKTMSSASEVITVATQDGCLRNNQEFTPGKVVVDACEAKCLCRGNNTWDCERLCKEPLVKAGTNQDPSCMETPVSDCCVKLHCPNTQAGGNGDDSFSDKPGSCLSSEKIRTDSGLCLEECQHDYHCTGLQKCCPTSCGGAVCSDSVNEFNRCDTIACGQNAVCIESRDPKSAAKCACRPGYRGDPNDMVDGCRKVTNNRSNLVCEYKNATYGPGEELYDGCDLKCVCSEALEIECAPRCPFKTAESSVTDPSCLLVQDPKDPCCKMIACESKPVVAFETTSINPNETIGETEPVDMPLPIVGCRHENRSFQPGESFTNGCESRCICRDGGHLRCAPRCPEYKGYDERLCRLIPDPDDPECCKIAVCDLKDESFIAANKEKEKIPLIIDSARVYNSSNIVLRVIMQSNQAIDELQFWILSSKVDSDHPAEGMKRNWQKFLVNKETYNLIEPGLFEVEFGGLEAATEYFLEVHEAKSNSTSNTVFVKTFPTGIDSSFNGCFYGNQIIQVGEEFFDGCEYKCICREGGTRECEDRCPVFIDTVGYEQCEWGPSPDDSCCTIPICKATEKTKDTPVAESNANTNSDGKKPETQPFCMGKDEKLHFIGDAWEESGPGGCLKQTCRCVQLANLTTTVRCHGGCPPIPPTALRSSFECPKPHLVKPKNECQCPYVICDHNMEEEAFNVPSSSSSPSMENQSSTASPEVVSKMAVTPSHSNDHEIDDENRHIHSGHNSDHEDEKMTDAGQGICKYKNGLVKVGKFFDACSATCECLPSGQVNCVPVKCSNNFFNNPTDECLEWELDPHFHAEPPNCCPRPLCKNDGSCFFAGLRFPNFKPIPQELLPCGTRCICMNANVTCENRCPAITEVPPANLPCPASMAYRGHLPGDECCLIWLCRETERAVSCFHNGNRYKIGEQWDDVNLGNILGPRQRCQCNPTPTGKPQVHCLPAVCPKITDRHLKPSMECPIPVVITPQDPILCPYVVCNYSEETGKELENVSVVAMNNSAVRIRFTLPALYVGLIGHAEVHYTNDPSLPRNRWAVQKFARPKRLFDTANIEYHLGGLKPNSSYFFQVKIVVEALRSGPQSQVYKLQLPKEPIALASSSTIVEQPAPQLTATSVTLPATPTLPPKVMMDVDLSAVPITENSLKVSWRSLESQEKSWIDGLKIRFKRLDEGDDSWLSTPMIHRDVNEYVLGNLLPGKAYAIDLVMKPSNGLNTQLISSKSVTIEIPNPRGEFDFNVSIDVMPDTCGATMRLQGVPQPTDKYIIVAKVSYKESDPDQLIDSKVVHVFRTPSPDGTIILDGLQPRRRYKAWVDLILSNNKAISSNSIIFTTKEESPKSHPPPRVESKNGLNKFGEVDPSANEAEALKEQANGEAARPYYIALLTVAVFAVITGIGFITLLCILMKNKTSAKAAITRAAIIRRPSEAAYDNPTYKTYDSEKPGEETIKNGSA